MDCGRPAPDRMCRLIHRRRTRNQAPVAMMSAEAFVKYALPALQPGIRKIQSLLGRHFSHPGRSPPSSSANASRAYAKDRFIAACITGYIVTFLNRRIITRKTLLSLLPISSKDLPERMMRPPPPRKDCISNDHQSSVYSDSIAPRHETLRLFAFTASFQFSILIRYSAFIPHLSQYNVFLSQFTKIINQYKRSFILKQKLHYFASVNANPIVALSIQQSIKGKLK